MPIPTLFNHQLKDKKLSEARYKWDVILSLVALILIAVYAIFSITDVLTKTTYEGICKNSGVTAKELCDDWVFRQCAYWGDQIGVQHDTTHPDYNIQMSKQDCQINEGGGCPVFDVTSPNFCTNWKGGRMLGDGELVTYLWQGQINQETVSFTGAANSANFMCCGQIEQTTAQKLIIWLGVLGGTAGLIMRIITAVPIESACGINVVTDIV